MLTHLDPSAKLRRSLSLPGHNLRTFGASELTKVLGEALLIPGVP